MAGKYIIDKYEAITKRFCEVEGSKFLPVRVLIDLAASEVNFNSNYVRYIINRHLYRISDYIYHKTGKNVTINPNLRADIRNNNIDRENYDRWIEYYKDKSWNDDPDFYDIIDEIVKENNILVLYYFYYKEEEELTKLLIDELNDFNDRKFFIIQ